METTMKQYDSRRLTETISDGVTPSMLIVILLLLTNYSFASINSNFSELEPILDGQVMKFVSEAAPESEITVELRFDPSLDDNAVNVVILAPTADGGMIEDLWTARPANNDDDTSIIDLYHSSTVDNALNATPIFSTPMEWYSKLLALSANPSGIGVAFATRTRDIALDIRTTKTQVTSMIPTNAPRYVQAESTDTKAEETVLFHKPEGGLTYADKMGSKILKPAGTLKIHFSGDELHFSTQGLRRKIE